MKKIELEALNRDALCDLRRSDFHINDLQDSLNTFQSRAESAKKRLSEAETKIAGLQHVLFPLFNFLTLLIIYLFVAELSDYVDRFIQAANHSARFVNARGAIPIVKLYDVPNRVREVAAHGAHRGVSIALAAAHIQYGQDLRRAPVNFSIDRSDEYMHLIDGYFNTFNPANFATLFDDIISRVFSNP